MTAGTRIFLWEAGPGHCGTAGTRERALELAGEFLGAAGEALVEEARLAMTLADGGMVQAHQRTGAAWRGRMLGGRPSWRACTAEPA